MKEKTPILIQGFVRECDEPLLEFMVLRDLCAIFESAGREELLQVIQLRMVEPEPFKAMMEERLSHTWKEAHVDYVVRDGIYLWVVGIGAVRAEHADVLNRCRVMDYPFSSEDPVEISA